MTIQDIVNDLKKRAAPLDFGDYNGFLAIQVSLSDLDHEPFYVEIKDGKLSVEPYEYHDRQANLIVSSGNFMKMVNQKLDPMLAFTTGKLKVEGDLGKAAELAELLKKFA